MQTRNEQIDIAKGIAIYLVVLGHLQLVSYNTSIVLISSCHMPIFFFISGLFFKKSYDKYTGKEFIINKLRTLITPYLIWSTVALFVNLILLIAQGQGNTATCIWEMYDIYFMSRSVWFLIVLFFTNIFAYSVFEVSPKNKHIFIILCILIWLITFIYGKITIFSLYKFQWLFPYFLLGIVVSYKNRFFMWLKRIADRNAKKQIAIMVSTVLVYVVCALVMCKEELFIEFYSTFTLEKQHIIYYLILYILGLIGIAAIIETASMITKLSILPNFFGKLGIYSIDIYVIHMFLVIIAKKIMILQSFPIWARS